MFFLTGMTARFGMALRNLLGSAIFRLILHLFGIATTALVTHLSTPPSISFYLQEIITRQYAKDHMLSLSF